MASYNIVFKPSIEKDLRFLPSHSPMTRSLTLPVSMLLVFLILSVYQDPPKSQDL
jgi:hypothetical protein